MRRKAGRAGEGELVARRSSVGTPGRRTRTQGLPPAARRAVQPEGAAKPPTTGDVATAAVAGKGAGAPLGGDVRRKIEPHLGADLSTVRIHGDAAAQAASAALGARAFTYGADIFLGSGETADDTRLIAHEATHVVQQGAAATPQRKIEVGAEDHPAEREADAVADRVVAGAPAGAGGRIVEDGAPLADGQIHRSEFLVVLRESVEQTAGAALGPMWSVAGCPYIEQWFAQHAGTDAASLERLAQRFSGAAKVTSARDYFAPIGARLQQGIQHWRAGADVSSELASAGLGAAAEAVAQNPPGTQAGGGAGPAAASGDAAGAKDGAASAAAAHGTDDAAGIAEMAAGPIAQRKKLGTALDPESPAQVAEELGPGQSLAPETASRMAGAFGQDFGHVRVHTDATAARKASALGAHAFTVGEHVAFGAGAYAPGTLAGDALLAHELAHVTQQSGTVARKPRPGDEAQGEPEAEGVDSARGPALEADADQAATAAVAHLHGGEGGGRAVASTALRSGLSLRRCDDKTSPPKAVAPNATPEIAATGDEMGKRVVDDMNKANAGPNTLDAGIHYWYNYRALCQQQAPSRWDDKLKAGMADPKYWDRYGWKQWRLKSGVSASEGLKSWIKGPTIAECRSAILAFETDAMRAAIGDAKFDAMFGSAGGGAPSAALLVIDSQGGDSSIEKYMKQTDAAANGTAGTVGNRPVKAGEWYYFYNHSMMLAKHPASSWQGENALFLGTNGAGKQIWAGLGTSSGGHSEVTEEQMYQQMADAYNKPRNADDLAKLDAIKAQNGGTLPAIYDESKLPTAMDQAKILADPGSNAVDGTFRKGGFSVGAGVTLDVDKVKAAR